MSATPPPEAARFCKDCRWAETIAHDYFVCAKPWPFGPNHPKYLDWLVTGNERDYAFCQMFRKESGPCGPAAVGFEPRPAVAP
jgi:hypothetical protein